MKPSTLIQTLTPLLLALPTVADDFSETNKLLGSLVTASDQFGTSCDCDGDVTVIGAPRRLDASTGTGAAYVFRGCAGILEEQRLTPSDGVAGDNFGHAVAVDGNVIVVGATQGGYDVAGRGNGAAYVYRFDGLTWVEEQKLTAPDGALDDAFGLGLDVQDNRIVIGAGNYDETTSGSVNSGAVYLYLFDGMQWNLEQELEGTGDRERFGFALSLDGDRLAIGALYWNSTLVHSNVGQVYMYKHDGASWTGDGIVGDPDWEREDYFGTSVSLKGDTLLVGAPGDDDDPAGWATQRGAAHVFRWDGVDWVHTQKLVPAGAVVGDRIGSSVCLGASNTVALVGNFFDDVGAQDAGSITVYGFDGDAWLEREVLTASDGQAEDRLYSAAISGGRVVAGTLGGDDLGTDAGSAYLFVAPFQSYAKGYAGTGGIVPTLGSSGVASPGGTVTIEYRDFLGGSNGLLLISRAPAELTQKFGATVLVDFFESRQRRPFTVSGPAGVAGAGTLDVPILLPNSPSLSCSSFYLQALAFDSGSSVNLSMTNGMILFVD